MKNNKNILIDKIGKELPFTVPENYFSQFALQIDKQISYKHAGNHRMLRNWMLMVAMFVGVLIVGRVFYSVYQNNLTKNNENYETYVLSQVDETSIVDYYVEQSNNK